MSEEEFTPSLPRIILPPPQNFSRGGARKIFRVSQTFLLSRPWTEQDIQNLSKEWLTVDPCRKKKMNRRLVYAVCTMKNRALHHPHENIWRMLNEECNFRHIALKHQWLKWIIFNQDFWIEYVIHHVILYRINYFSESMFKYFNF